MAELRFVPISEVENINIFGRLGKVRDPLPLLFNGSAVEVVVTGSDLWIDFETDNDFHEPWVAYELNGAFMGRQMVLAGEHSICLFRNMNPDTPKRVRFYRELQAMSEDDKCKVLVKGFRLDGEFMEVPKYDLKIEFIGDSITSGEGSYGAVTDVDWLAMYMSASVNYATMTAKALNADYHIVSQGGWGVFCGWDNDVRHNIPSIYEKVCGLAMGPSNEALGTQDPYDFDSWQPDVIVVNLGTNDASAFEQPPLYIEELGATFKQRKNEDGSYNREDELKVVNAAISFLEMLRKHNHHAHIIWAYGMLGSNLNLTLTEAINKYREKSGDNNVSFFQLPNTTMRTFGAHMHPGAQAHLEASKVLADYIKEIINL
ncbi:GDSL-like Lipase/Acylhydrolase family protein [Butyrivibrio hungatei DSM 14810]|uniref:GDSL-like Lipase/Acylhydrolase family protein n=1 Tax=Butyrivibrio hungatei DSM 14810 TaxID=1121132 RepID=A0A1M7SNF2_9FIRM|nr:SGNH/GDSL hydrolase family protein [Butyrivibrio hungatei]SHN59990.1 GDSL-like Lipase/Acylhydrolase family protein [Butyrivibrio hungatei DSM 14810]